MTTTADTRAWAEASILPHKVATRQAVLDYITEHGPVCDEQIANGLNMRPNTARPRRVELAQDDEIEAAPQTVTTSSGRQAIAWVVKST